LNKIAVISDIHGNIPALEAVLKDINLRKIEKVFCLGDLVGKGPHPERVIDIIKQTCEVVVYGNWDDGITKLEDDGDINKWRKDRLGIGNCQASCHYIS
jgi:protein phosphatase